MKKLRSKFRRVIKSKPMVKLPLAVFLSIASAGLGAYMLHGMLAVSDLEQARLEAGYTPPLASVKSEEVSDINSKSPIGWLQIMIVASMITIPLAGGMLYVIRSIKSNT